MDLLHDVSACIERYKLVRPGTTIVVGVSGGPDSVALLHLLQQIAPTLDLELHVAHLHHGIRGADADADLEFVTQLARDAGLPLSTESADVPALAAGARLALEETARRVRYTFLARVAEKVGAQTIAVGHNADDQAETVLMHLLRGAGPAGLRGMLPATRLRDYHLLQEAKGLPQELVIIRPLITATRAEIEAYCDAAGLATRLDRSNFDTTYFRNRLRHEVLPYLAQINPRISERLRNLAEVVRADYGLLHEFITAAQNTLLVAAYPDALVYDLRRWREQPLAVRRGLIRRSAYELRRSLRDVAFGHVEHAVNVAQNGQTGARATLPRALNLTVGYTTLIIAQSGALHLPVERPWLEPEQEVLVTIPGTTALSGGWVLHAVECTDWDSQRIETNPDPLVAWIDKDALGSQVVIRTRRDGDRFQPQGMHGAEVRLSDYLINTKLPRPWRDHLPLLTSDNRLLWVIGMRVSHRALVHATTTRVVHLRVSGPPENATRLRPERFRGKPEEAQWLPSLAKN